jgi:hypothetical protein
MDSSAVVVVSTRLEVVVSASDAVTTTELEVVVEAV